MKADLNKLFKAIADPTRRDILNMLVVAGAALTIHQISEQFEISRQGVTKHIAQLEDAGLVHISTKGRERLCSALPTHLKHIHDWVNFYATFWDSSLDRLEDHLK